MGRLSLQERTEIFGLKGYRSAAQVAVMFGTSRGNVTNIWARGQPRAARRPYRLQDYAQLPWVKLSHKQRQARRILQRMRLNNIKLNLAPAGKGKTLLELGPEDCRWVLGRNRNGAAVYCGCRRTREFKMAPMYCEEHSHRAVRILPVVQVGLGRETYYDFDWLRRMNAARRAMGKPPLRPPTDATVPSQARISWNWAEVDFMGAEQTNE